MSQLSKSDQETTEAIGAVIGELTVSVAVLFLKGYLLMLVMSWIFPMFILPYWKWLVITATINLFIKTRGSSNS